MREIFTEFGAPTKVDVPTDRMSGLNRGFGYVEYATPEEAGLALKRMDGAQLDGQVGTA